MAVQKPLPHAEFVSRSITVTARVMVQYSQEWSTPLHWFSQTAAGAKSSCKFNCEEDRTAVNFLTCVLPQQAHTYVNNAEC